MKGLIPGRNDTVLDRAKAAARRKTREPAYVREWIWMNRPFISTCIITQNNAASLARAMASVERFADEIVVVDGGSTDDTESIVRAHPKCLYLSRPFEGNFAAQKNFGFDHASGDWVFELDDDEVVCDEFGRNIRPLLERTTNIGFAIRRWWVSSIDPLQHVSTELFETTWIPRVFRNQPQLRYVVPPAGAHSGTIHHEFSAAVQHLFVRLDAWRILHFHYLLRNRTEREARFAWFNRVDPRCTEMNARCYLYENFSHRIEPCPARWQPEPSLIETPTASTLSV